MVGIITFHRALNYGAVLQAYALQQKLQQMGLDNELIDYRCEAIQKAHRIRFTWKNPMGYFIKKKTEKAFHQFLEEKCKMSAPLEAGSTPSGYEACIAGSDQIWNQKLSGGDLAYYLKDVSAKKYSYAASMGGYMFEKGNTSYEYLRDFSGLSMREQSGAVYIGDLLNKEVSVHIDPVMLLTADQWKKIAKHRKLGNYILLYMIGYKREVVEEAKRLSKLRGLPVFWLSDSVRRIPGVRQQRCCSPEEFIGMFADSTCIVTNSFHGTAFSILFEKEFYSAAKVDGVLNTRVGYLLQWTGLKECTTQNIGKKIQPDWNLVQELLEQKRQDADEYLFKLLKKVQ